MSHTDPVKDFDNYPDTALISFGKAALLSNLSVSTAYRLATSGRFPMPLRVSERVTAIHYGELRRYLADPEAYQRSREVSNENF